uniref:Uncharacterized protein n=1 Tax=Octopus bimaculoides TaxID=37653 RepID=A0A0L8HML2_OCTBM
MTDLFVPIKTLNFPLNINIFFVLEKQKNKPPPKQNIPSLPKTKHCLLFIS